MTELPIRITEYNGLPWMEWKGVDKKPYSQIADNPLGTAVIELVTMYRALEANQVSFDADREKMAAENSSLRGQVSKLESRVHGLTTQKAKEKV